MQLTVKKWGNSAAIRLPQALLTQFNLREGDDFEVVINGEGLLLRPILKTQKPVYDLKTLLNEMPPELPQVEGWEEMPLIGDELI